MKGLVTRLVKLFLGWVVVVAGVIYGLHLATGRSPVEGLGAGLLAGSLGWMAAACLWVAICSLRQRSAIRRGTRELPSQDGPAVLIGRIDTARPMVAPLDGRECVAYTYEVTRDVKSGRSWTRFGADKGVGLAPSQIVTGAGTFRLLAVPTIEGAEATDAPREVTLRRFEHYLGETTFTKRTAGAAGTGVAELEARWSDSDGDYRSDISDASGSPAELDGCRFEQQTVPRGAQVCLLGHYSTTQRGIVADPDWRTPCALRSATRPRQAPSWRHEPGCSSSSRPSSPSRRPGSSRRLPRPRVPSPGRTRSRGAKLTREGLSRDTALGPRPR